MKKQKLQELLTAAQQINYQLEGAVDDQQLANERLRGQLGMVKRGALAVAGTLVLGWVFARR